MLAPACAGYTSLYSPVGGPGKKDKEEKGTTEKENSKMKTEAETEIDRQEKSIHYVMCTHACTLPDVWLNCKQTAETVISNNLQIDKERDRNDRVT